MKLLFAGDNRTKTNWGCRATGISLSQLLTTRFAIGETIYGNWIGKPYAVKLLSDDLDQTLYGRLPGVAGRGFRFVTGQYGTRRKLITPDPVETAQNFKRFAYRIPQFAQVLRMIDACDALVINGEGDMIFGEPPRQRLLYLFALMELVREQAKPFAYVNGMVSDAPDGTRNQHIADLAVEYLTQASFVGIRDEQSLAILKALAPDTNAHFYPDALFAWEHYYADMSNLPLNGDFLLPWVEDNALFGTLDFSQPYICVSGSSSARLEVDPARSASVFAELITALKTLRLPVIVVMTSDDAFLREAAQRANVPYVPYNVPIVAGGAVLANARLLVSGRYHPSIFAALGGAPCVFMGSNSHKTRSLPQILDYPADLQEYDVLPDSDEIARIVSEARIRLDEGEARRASIRAAAVRNGGRVRQLPDALVGALTGERQAEVL